MNTIRSLLTPQMAAAVSGLIATVIGLAIQFGVHITDAQTAAILATFGATWTVVGLAFHANATAKAA